jgi:transketolase
MDLAARDRDIVVLCSDSRGSASLTAFYEHFPKQFVEIGIAEQNLVSVAAGLATAGKKAVAASPACFLSTRSLEQIKVDCAYTGTNVKLIGISGGISYGALGMTHHSAQDSASLAATPGMRVYLPSDRVQTAFLMRTLMEDSLPAYIRVGRNAVPDIYPNTQKFSIDKAVSLKEGTDIAIIACGEMVYHALEAARILESDGLSAGVLDVYCLKPLDESAIVAAAKSAKVVITVEEHSPFGGLGSRVSAVLSEKNPSRIKILALPDEPVIAGTSAQVFAHHGLDAEGIVRAARQLMEDM